MREQYRLPSGKYTVDVKRYCREWKALARPIEEAAGVRLHAFDPGLQFACPRGEYTAPFGGTVFQVPVSVAIRLKAALDELPKQEEKP